MPAGLQVWRADGSVSLDTTTLLGRIFGAINVAQGQQSGIISHPQFALGTPFGVPLFDVGNSNFGQAASLSTTVSMPNFQVIGNELHWSRVQSSYENYMPAGVIYYGTY